MAGDWKRQSKQPGLGMNFRIERLANSDTEIVLQLCGRIQSDQLDTIRQSIESETLPVVLDLNQVTLVDRTGVVFLAKCGFELRNLPGFISKWIAQERGQRKPRHRERTDKDTNHPGRRYRQK